MIEVGKCYYFICHAYHHFLGEVVEITGKKECIIKNVRKIHSCSRNWTKFFKEGAKEDTKFDTLPDGVEISGWCTAIPWNHKIPQGNNDS